MPNQAKITQKYVQEWFSYDPDTGLCIVNQRPESHFSSLKYTKIVNSRCAGKELGTKDKYGYHVCSCHLGQFKVHRLIWLHFYGHLPKSQIDHIDGDVANNRLSNLRDVPNSINQKNQSLRSTNKSGHVGVWENKKTKIPQFQAYIMVNFKKINLGCFRTLEEAIEARAKANIKYGFHENHGRL